MWIVAIPLFLFKFPIYQIGAFMGLSNFRAGSNALCSGYFWPQVVFLPKAMFIELRVEGAVIIC